MSKNRTQAAKTYSIFDKIVFIHLSLFFPAFMSTAMALVEGFSRLMVERGVGYPIASRTLRVFIRSYH